MKKFNLNNYVYFQPNEIGLRIYNDYFLATGGHCLSVDDNGFAKLQMHIFIEVYGREIFTSCIHQELPFKNYEIFFEEEDLEGESNVAKLAIAYAQQKAIISQLKMELEMLRNAKTMQVLSSGGCISSNEKIVSASVFTVLNVS